MVTGVQTCALPIYIDLDMTIRRSIQHQVGDFSQAMMAENIDMYKPIRLR